MLKDHPRAVATSLFIVDLAATICSFVAAWILVNHLTPTFGMLAPLDHYLWLLLFIVPTWTALLHWSSAYDSKRVESLIREVWQVSRTVAMGGIALFAFVGLTKSSHVSRPFLATFTMIDFAVLVLIRILIRTLAHGLRARGLNTRSVLVVGTGAGASAHAERIARNPHWGHRIIGYVSEDEPSSDGGIPRSEILGTTRDIRRILCEYVVDEVIVTVAPSQIARLDALLLQCEEIGVKTRLTLDYLPHRLARIDMEYLDDCPVVTFSTTPPEGGSMMVKRAIDVVFSALFLAAFTWLYLGIALLIKLTSRGSVFYRQERVGMNGRRFAFFKFRSMIADADRRKAELQHLNEMDGPVFKIKNDPRVTRVGRFLRKYSLDELPQMWNVLRGDMSLVGPRPPVPSEVEKYESWERRRLSVRPGLTCLWQISGRNLTNFKQWMELDLAYIDHWTLGLDLKILLKTVPAVLAGKGAS